ncbi:MAG: transposase [Saprospiraceae bacterium]|nr:transposase [Saprospiraceae bacterium]
MARRKILDPKGLNFLTLTTVGWIDAFSRLSLRNILITNLDYCRQNKGMMIHAYVIMTNHIHLIVQMEADHKESLNKVIGDFKRYTAHQLIKTILEEAESRKEWILYLLKYFAHGSNDQRSHQFWQSDNYPTALFTDKVIWEKVHYIHQNPVRAGFVANPEDYLYSSASNYFNGANHGLIEIDLLEPYLPNSGFEFIPDEHRPIL